MTTHATTYADAIRETADDVIRQMIDGEAPHRQEKYQAASGAYFPSARVFFADIGADSEHGIPAGVARVTIDLAGWRWPKHAVEIYLDSPGDGTTYVADDLAAAVLDMIDSTADYAR